MLAYKGLFVLFMIVSSVAVVLENIRPYFYKILINKGSQGEYSQLLGILLLYGGSWILSDLLTSLANFLGDRVAVPASADARKTVFKKIPGF